MECETIPLWVFPTQKVRTFDTSFGSGGVKTHFLFSSLRPLRLCGAISLEITRPDRAGPGPARCRTRNDKINKNNEVWAGFVSFAGFVVHIMF